MEALRTWLGVAILALAGRCIFAGEPPRCSAWELVNPSPQANHLRDVAYGGGRWVAVGEGVAVVSQDAAPWTAVPVAGHPLRGVAYGAGVFVAVGAAGTVLRSPDGVAWAEVGRATALDLMAVGFAAGTFLAVGHGGVALISADGNDWSVDDPGAGGADLDGLRVIDSFAGDPGPLFLAWGPRAILVRSPAGLWRALQFPATVEVSAAAFAVNGAIFASFTCPGGNCEPWPQFGGTRNGVTWAQSSFGHYASGPADVAEAPTRWVALNAFDAAQTHLWRSFDGRSWEEQPSEIDVPLRAVAFGDGPFVAVGDFGAIWTSVDGETWHSATGPSRALDRVAWNGTSFAASAVWIVTAPSYWYGLQRFTFGGDGRQWNPSASNLDLAAAGPGLFVATGGSMSYPGSNAFSSIDGVAWTQRSSLPSRPLVGGMWDGERFVILIGGWEVNCRVLCNPNSLFAAIGDGVSEWLAVEQPELGGQSALSGMAYNGERYVALGGWNFPYGSPRILVSEGGLSWRHVGDAPGVATGLQAVASDGRGFVAVRGSIVLTSPDGLDWSSADIAPLHLIGVMWTGDEYVAVGDDGAGHAAVARSPDGAAWTSEALPAIPARLLAVAGGQRVQLAVGQAGLTLRRECHPQSPSRRLRGAR